MFYALTSKKASKIAYYISLYVRHFGAHGIFQCDNGREFKGTLLIFLKNMALSLSMGDHGHHVHKDLLSKQMP